MVDRTLKSSYLLPITSRFPFLKWKNEHGGLMWKEAVCHRDGQVSVERRDSAVTVSISHPTPGPRFCSHSLHLPPDTWSQILQSQSPSPTRHLVPDSAVTVSISHPTPGPRFCSHSLHLPPDTWSQILQSQSPSPTRHLVPSALVQAVGNRIPLLQNTNWQQNTVTTGY